MAITATDLISYAYYTSGIVSRQFQQVSGLEINDGLVLLNEILTDKTIQLNMLPYMTTHYEFNAVINQEQYFIPGLTQLETLTFFINNVRYNMRQNSRNEYFGTARANNIDSLPWDWYAERCLGGMNIFLYFFPDQAYPMEITGLFSLQTISSLSFDLTTILDEYYCSYLKYRLCKKLCALYNFTMPIVAQQELDEYEGSISKASAPMDLRLKYISTLGGSMEVNYAIANLSNGFITP
jgi:hypothetical protein